MLVRMVSSDPRSTTCKNLRYLKERTGHDQPERFSTWRMTEVLAVQDLPQADIVETLATVPFDGLEVHGGP